MVTWSERKCSVMKVRRSVNGVKSMQLVSPRRFWRNGAFGNMRILIWSVRRDRGHDRRLSRPRGSTSDVCDDVRRSCRGNQRVWHLRCPSRNCAEFSVRAPAFRPDTVRGEWRQHRCATKARVGRPTRTLAPHLSNKDHRLGAEWTERAGDRRDRRREANRRIVRERWALSSAASFTMEPRGGRVGDRRTHHTASRGDP